MNLNDNHLILTISSEIVWRGEHAYTNSFQIMAAGIHNPGYNSFFLLPTFGLPSPNLFMTMLRAKDAVERSKEEFNALQVANIESETFPRHITRLIGCYAINKDKNWLHVCEQQSFIVLDFIGLETFYIDMYAARAFVRIFSTQLIHRRFGIFMPSKGPFDNGIDVLILPHSGAMITFGESIVKAALLAQPNAIKERPLDYLQFETQIKQIFGNYDLLPFLALDHPIVNWSIPINDIINNNQ
jgi:hypothetical protein